jgi:hypothetical protein
MITKHPVAIRRYRCSLNSLIIHRSDQTSASFSIDRRASLAKHALSASASGASTPRSALVRSGSRSSSLLSPPSLSLAAMLPLEPSPSSDDVGGGTPCKLSVN